MYLLIAANLIWADEGSKNKEAIDTATQPTVETPVIIKPKLPRVLKVGKVNYPEAPLKAGRGADVFLELHIDAEGKLLDVKVIEQVGEGFDEAALEAIQNYEFSPAINAMGQPDESRIQFRIRFEPQKAPPLVISGQLFEAGIRKPIANSTIKALGPNKEVVQAITDATGKFRFSGLANGKWIIAASGTGLQSKTQTVIVKDGRVADAKIYLIRDKARTAVAQKAIVVQARRITSQITERALSSDEIRFMPGSNGDVVKAVQNLPGISRSPFGNGALIIRGLAPEESRYQIDGLDIPIIFHFGGLTTVVNSDSIDEVAYLPGNYGVKYGRQLGGVVDLRTKDDLPEKTTGYTAIDIFQTTAFYEQKINDNSSISISGRRSYADVILNPILNSYDINVRAPRYYDFQTRYLYKSKKWGTFDALFLLSDDGFAILGGDDEDDETETDEEEDSGSDDGTIISFTTTFQKLRLRWKKDLANKWKNELSLITGPQKKQFDIVGGNEAYEKAFTFQIREEVRLDLSPKNNIGWRFGLDLYTALDSYKYDFSGFIPDALEEDDFIVLSPALYAENTARIGKLLLYTGLRGELMTLDGAEIVVPAIDPRLGFRYRVGEIGSIKGGIGQFTQFPLSRELSPSSEGNPDLTTEKAIQMSLGWKQNVNTQLSYDVTGFYSDLRDLIVGQEDRFAFRSGPPDFGERDTDEYANAGAGTVYGIETQIKYEAVNTIAMLSGTLSRSTRVNRAGETRLFTYDQPYLLNGIVSHQFEGNWRAGVRMRYGAGNPYTPVVNRIYNLNNRRFLPVYGESDSGRLPPFFSLDVRIDKDFVFNTWTLTAYADIQNLTNAVNVEIMQWSSDYTQEEPIQGLPIFPAFGLRGEF